MSISKKILLVIIVLLLSLTSNIFAVDLKYMVEDDDDGKLLNIDLAVYYDYIDKELFYSTGKAVYNKDKYCVMYTFTQPYSGLISSYEAVVGNGVRNEFIKSSETTDTLIHQNLTGTNATFQTSKLVFNSPEFYHNKREWISPTDNGGIPFYYDEVSDKIDNQITNLINKGIKGIKGYINRVKDWTVNYSETYGANPIIWKLDMAQFDKYMYEDSYGIFKNPRGEDYVVIKRVIPKEWIDALVKNYTDYGITNSELSDNGIRFSSVLSTKPKYLTNASKNYSSDIYNFSRWASSVYKSGWHTNNLGFSAEWNWGRISTAPYNPATSVANLYQNLLFISNDILLQNEAKVYVNYYDTDGNLFATKPVVSPEQTLGNGNKIVTESQTNGFHELFKLKGDNTLIYNPKQEFNYSGKKYSLVNHKVASGNDENVAKGNITISSYGTKTPINIKNEKKVYIINLYYDDSQTNVYVKHFDAEGNPLTGIENLSLTTLKNGVESTIQNSGAKFNYPESYVISEGTTLYTKAAYNPKFGEDEYRLLYAKVGADLKTSNLESSINGAKNNLGGEQEGNIAIQAKQDVSEVYVVHYYYVKTDTISNLPNLELVGKLAFINNVGTEYDNATSGIDTDYVPSGGNLTPYIHGAYPYVVRALKYEAHTEPEQSISTNVKATQKYSSKEWYYKCSPSSKTVPDGKNKDGTTKTKTVYDHSNCGYKHRDTSTKTLEKTFNYTVKYKNTYYNLTNFKMYQIANMILRDNNNDNQGGELFENSNNLSIDTSKSYKNMFTGGISDSNLTIKFDNKEYEVQSEIYIDTTMPTFTKGSDTDSSCSSSGTVNSDLQAEDQAQNLIDAETHKSASDRTELTIEYNYWNDYITLDRRIDMLAKNEITWSEHITKATDSIVRELNSTKNTNSIGKTSSIIGYTANLYKYMPNGEDRFRMPTTWLTTEDDFSPNYRTIPELRENGMRILSGDIKYEIVTDPKYNRGSDTFDATDATYEIQRPINIINNSYTRINIDRNELKDQERSFEGEDEVNKVTVLTPMEFGDFKIETDDYVDHSGGVGSQVLQRGAEFKITPNIAGYRRIGYSFLSTVDYVKGYYYQFDFDIIYLGVGNSYGAYIGNSDTTLVPNTTIDAGTVIYVQGNKSTLIAKTTEDEGSSTANQIQNKIKIIAASTNITEALENHLFGLGFIRNYRYMNGEYVRKQENQDEQYQDSMLSRTDIYQDSYHAIYKEIYTKNVGRIYDFAVTDCNDLAFKDVFRITTGGNVNESTGTAYYVGYNKLDIGSGGFNDIVPRGDEIKSNLGVDTVLPLGPYKHTGKEYVSSPKMGYRISFDLKTTGYISNGNANNTRKIKVTPTYYYMSKDGNVTDFNIELYYKNASGQYVNFRGSDYSIYFTPNDGYRHLRNVGFTDVSKLTTKLEQLIVAPKINGESSFILDSRMMATNNSGYLQSWYGEYKLPNSTIAFSKTGANNTNINNPYNNGYLGVIFGIECIDYNESGRETLTIAYGNNNQQANPNTNTSQWDYEGYLNFKNPGSAVSSDKPLYLTLEGGSIAIDNNLYNKIKGTVVLYDLDNRAADDFQ